MKLPSFLFNLPERRQPQSSKLIELAKKLDRNDDFNNLSQFLNIPPFTVRSIEEILTDIESDRSHTLSALEWVYLIHTQAGCISTARVIWQVAIVDLWICKMLCWQLALYYGDSQPVLAPILVDCFPEFAPQLQKIKPLSISIIAAISGNEPTSKLAEIAHAHLLTPQQLLKQAQLPSQMAITVNALEYVAAIFCGNPTSDRVEWLIQCLDKMMVEQQLQSVEYLLADRQIKALSHSLTSFVEWLDRYYGPRTTGDRRYHLSRYSKQTLSDWVDAVNYSDFANLVSKMLEVIEIKEFESNQLRRRREFWAKYTNSFERIRILLSQDAIDLCGNDFSFELEILKCDDSSPTEVCIFDFGDYFVVDFFRGTGGEIRLFARTREIEDQLFGSHQLSIKCLRRLGGEVHDRMYLWQFYCEQWLLEKGICLNSGVLPARSPAYHQKLDRDSSLVRWRSEISTLEAEARAYMGC